MKTAFAIVIVAAGVAALGLLGSGCSAKLSGDLTVDGQPFELSSCRSGQVYGFVGVELSAKSGARLRLVQTPTGAGLAVVFPPGVNNGVELGPCGTFTVSRQSSTINDITNVEGSATLECATDAHSIKGTVKFGNCH